MTAAVTERLIALVDRSIQASDENTRQMRVSFEALNGAVVELRSEIQDDRARGEQVTRELTGAITELRIFVGRLDERLVATNQRFDGALASVQTTLQAQTQQIGDLTSALGTVEASLQTQTRQIGDLTAATRDLSRAIYALDQRTTRHDVILNELTTTTQELSRSNLALDRRMTQVETVLGELVTTTQELSRSNLALDRRMARFETTVVVLVAVASIVLAALQIFLR